MVGGHRDRTGRNRGVDETRTVGFAACEREEKIARFHHAAVDGEAGDVNRRSLRIDPGVIAKKVAKSHSLGPAGRGNRLKFSGSQWLTGLSSMPQE
jgi:hypothetical protein